ncbi:MAG: cytidine deaminase [Firmicutes bacterium]|nr:cytidine deaminase [Bacillota bacterium]
MFEKLRKLQENSYVPLTNYRTASIVVTKDGKGFPGVNVENPSFRDGMCAEQNAIAAACSAGYGKGDFALLYVITDGQTVSTPCFLCRQVINELFSPDSPIICYSTTGEKKVFTVRQLCPSPFDESDLV